MQGYFLDNVNIEGKGERKRLVLEGGISCFIAGGVVAAPDYDTPGGSYYFHWERDGALTMRALQESTDR